jgi:undecaprenyl-diphosphatase
MSRLAVVPTTPPESVAADGRPWWRTTWPLGRRQWAMLGLALVVVTAVGVLVGLALTDWFAPNPVTRLDLDLARRIADDRSATGTELARWGANVSETPVKIGITLVVSAVMLWRFRRWYEAVFVALPLVFEASVFMLVTLIVQRPRPPVPHLLGSPVASSFPSGHAAAATVYLVIAIVVFRHTRSVVARAAITIAVVSAPLVVAWARMYQGMHHLSDVIAGILIGLVSIAICSRILGPPPGPVPSGYDAHDRHDAVHRPHER